jgi:hypothetical protein
MTLPDSTAGAQLASGYFSAAWLAYLDFNGDPVRVTTAKVSLEMAATGDADLDGFTFDAVNPELVGVSAVQNAEGGSETLTFTLSGIVGPDSDLLAVLGDRSLWRLRPARLWAIVYDEDGVQQGAVWPVYTGRMSAMQITGDPGSQTVRLEVESYLASLRQASGRTYLDQEQFDPSDNTAALKLGVANGATKGVVSTSSQQLGGPEFFAPGVPF